MNTAKAILFTSIMTLATHAAHAKLIAYEPFDYEDGNGESLAGTDTGYGWGGAVPTWTLGTPSGDANSRPYFARHNMCTNGVVQYDFSYADTNGIAVVTHGNTYAKFTDSHHGGPWEGTTARRTLAETNVVSIGDSIWISFLGTHQGTGASKAGVANRTELTLLSPDRGANSWAIVCGAVDNDSGNLKWGIHHSSKPYYAYATNLVQTYTASLVIAQIKITKSKTASVNLWVNPPDISSEQALGTPQKTSTNQAVTPEFYGVYLTTHKSKTLLFDELRIGTTLRDVIVGDIPPEATLVIIR